MPIQASLLFDEFRQRGLLQEMSGDDVAIERIAAVEHCSSGDLVFVDREVFVEPALDGGAAAVITNPGLAAAFADAPRMAVMTASNVKLARALVTQRFFDRELRPQGTPHIDPSAVVADSARIGANVYVGPGAKVGEDTVILANAVVEEGAVIGDRTVIHPCVVIGFECEIGHDVIIRAGTIIGSEGFGFAQDEKRMAPPVSAPGRSSTTSAISPTTSKSARIAS
jgi:UDP-3-O-[3-hydroxymyristoyl] glucosamine N-acyltransferase